MGPVVRTGDRVVREAGEWTPAVHRLLRHLRSSGVPGIPEPHGLTSGEREVLDYLDGVVPAYPMPAWAWNSAALVSAAQLLRRIHDATEGVDLDGPWRSPAHEPAEVICHNDFAPYNLVFDAGAVVGVIDWDYASPGPRVWDLAYLAYRIVPMTTHRWGDTVPDADRRERLDRLLGEYGTDIAPHELTAVLRERLFELATFSDTAARRLSKPELSEHARGYRHDAAHLPEG